MPVNVHDLTVTPKLLTGKENNIYGNSSSLNINDNRCEEEKKLIELRKRPVTLT